MHTFGTFIYNACGVRVFPGLDWTFFFGGGNYAHKSKHDWSMYSSNGNESVLLCLTEIYAFTDNLMNCVL